MWIVLRDKCQAMIHFKMIVNGLKTVNVEMIVNDKKTECWTDCEWSKDSEY